MANDDKTPVGIITHDEKRANIPSAELEPVLRDEDKAPLKTAWERRNRDLDPQLVWRGKDPDQAELTVDAPPIYLQEQVHPKALIDDLRNGREKADDLFGHFGLTEEDREAEVEFYRHTRKWSNRMILGDALQVMASLAEREGLKGQVQAIYIDPPYGIRFNSNFQWSTTSRDVKDGKLDHLTREPEQVKAFRDTWRDGIHSYLSYLRDRLAVSRELLTESGSCFVQIGDENVHRVRALMDEVFGEENFVSQITFKKTGGQSSVQLPNVCDFILWYSKSRERLKYRAILASKGADDESVAAYTRVDFGDGTEGSTSNARWKELSQGSVFQPTSLTSQNPGSRYDVTFLGRTWFPRATQWWKTDQNRLRRLIGAGRVVPSANILRFKRYLKDYAAFPLANVWEDIGGIQSRLDPKIYVVQTSVEAIKRCLLMTTDPGDLVLDPTCGSGTTAYVAEQWGRRWITIDTSRVALAPALWAQSIPGICWLTAQRDRRRPPKLCACRHQRSPLMETFTTASSTSACLMSR